MLQKAEILELVKGPKALIGGDRFELRFALTDSGESQRAVVALEVAVARGPPQVLDGNARLAARAAAARPVMNDARSRHVQERESRLPAARSNSASGTKPYSTLTCGGQRWICGSWSARTAWIAGHSASGGSQASAVRTDGRTSKTPSGTAVPGPSSTSTP